MSGVLNDCDALLQAAGVRILNPKDAFINLTPSAPGFHMTGAGAVDIATVTVSADLVALDGNVVFTVQGGTLSNATARTVDVTYVNGAAVVTATVTTNGETFARSCVIPVLRDGAKGADGQPVYTWIKYADTAAGVGLSDDPAGKTYIGLAHNKSTAAESTNPADYTWALMKGGDGLPGAKGADGITYYTWIKYADQADGTGLYDTPNANTLYIGIAVNRATATESTTKTDYVWSRFKGEQGVAGAPTYTWIKYADSAAGAGLSDDPTGKAYVGFSYNQASATESTVATDYTWSLIKGTDGQPGGKGADGATLYTWIKYADVADGTGLYDTPTANTLYIGIATNKSTATESTVKTDYVWSKFKGDQGVQGPTTYTWVKYADSAAGAGLSDDPTGKAYIGFAYNKSTASESTTATDYTWSLIKGTDGQPGGKGADGQTLYTWIKYSDNADGAGLYDLPTAGTQYLGIAVNKTTATESTIKTDYVWSKFRGADGVGTTGARGAGHYYVAGSSWSDVVAQAACPGGPVNNDVVTISSGTYVMEKRWTGSVWVDNGVVINGKLIVPESILTSSIDTRGLLIRATSGNGGGVIIDENGLRAGYEAPGTKNSEIKIGGRNLYKKDSAFGVLVAGSYITARTTTGFILNGINANTGSMRLGGVVTSNGEYTISFDLRAADANGFFVEIDVCDGYGGAAWTISPTTTSQRFERTFTVAGVTDFSIFNFVDFSRLSNQGHHFTNFKIEVGNKATAYTPAPDDVAADISTAKAAADAANNALPDKVSKSAANIMTGAGALISGTLTTDANGYRTGGSGTAMTSRGWVAYNSAGALTFQLDAGGGNPFFAGQLYAASGTFKGDVLGGDYTGWSNPPGGQGKGGYCLSAANGLIMGSYEDGRYFVIYSNGDAAAPGFNLTNKQITLTNTILISPIFEAFTASLSGGAITSSGGNGTRSLGSRQIIGSGGKLPYRSISWAVTDLEGNSAARTIISGENTDIVSVTASGANATTRTRITGTITDANGLTASASFTTNANFGSI